MQRVLVLGCSGAGKSTFARRLGAITGLPVVHLDQHYWLPGWREIDPAAWNDLTTALAERSHWIMDGNYSTTIQARLAVADTAFFLDAPRWLCLWRVIWRSLTGFGRTRADLGPDCPDKLPSWEFVKYIWTYNAVRRAKMLKRLEHFPGQALIFRTRGEANRYLASLQKIQP